MDRLLRNTTFALLILGFNYPSLASFGHNGMANQLGSGDTNQYCDTEKKIKCGYWIHYGKDMPKAGYPEDSKLEEGPYNKNRKDGTWIKYHKNGQPRLIGDFTMGRPNGPYQKITEDGIIWEEGNWDKTLKRNTGKLIRRDQETGNIIQEFNLNEQGEPEGTQKEFYADGTLWMEYSKKQGKTVGEKVEYYPNGDVKKKTVYNDTGEVTDEKAFEPTNPDVVKEETGKGLGLEDGESVNSSDKFDPDGFNTVYNKNDDPSKVGTFKNGRFMEGKRYVYDSDGILVKVEQWKNGKYHSDVQQ